MNPKYLEKIIKGCIAGKTEYQEKLFRLISDKMFGVCLYYSKDYSEAEDILHDGFLKIFKNISKYKNKGSFEGWTRRIIINTALEKHKKENYLYPINDDYEYIDEINNKEEIINNITAKDLIKLIQSLSPKYRMVFNLYAIEGYSHKEISKMLNISESTSKSNLSRARAILQKKVKKYFYLPVNQQI